MCVNAVGNEEQRMRDPVGLTRDGRGTSQTPTLKLPLLTGGAACQQAMLETPLCLKLVGDPWKLEDSSNVWESAKTAGPAAQEPELALKGR